MEAHTAAESTQVLRETLQRDGYLLLRHLLDPVAVEEMRSAYFDQFEAKYFEDRDAGVFVDGAEWTGPFHGTEGHPAWETARSELFRQFAEQDVLFDLAEDLLDASVFTLERRPVRSFWPNSHYSSRAHTDEYFGSVPGKSQHMGTMRFLTMWVPIGDVPLRTGGLVYLEDSQQVVPEEIREKLGDPDRGPDALPIAADLKALADLTNRRWAWTDYRAGDVVVHTPRTVHASLDCETRYARMSTDLRFVNSADRSKIDQRWMVPWSSDDGI
jgi:hypothetical protein